jgi:aryl-alcohol dehydrogenase-like predicted oxidoreductase
MPSLKRVAPLEASWNPFRRGHEFHEAMPFAPFHAPSKLDKLGLGTVQFGQAYGVSNTRGQVPAAEVAQILDHAGHAGIRLIDTAANYGSAENVLASLDTSLFRIVTKTRGLKQGIDAVVAGVRQSAQLLDIETLLVHQASDLAGPQGEDFWNALRGLREEGLFRRLGISAYISDDPAGLAARFRPDVMQLPFSLLDQRLLGDGTLARLKELGVEIHARSVFLQGLLFLERLPEKLQHAAPYFKTVRARIRDAGVTPLRAALGFVLSRPEVDAALVGVTSLASLHEIIAACHRPMPELDWPSLALDDELVLTPSLW